MKQGNLFAVTFSAVAVSAAQDLFELVAAASSKLVLREVRLGQYSDFGDAAAELLSVLIIRNYTTSGSGGSAFTPLPFNGISGARVAVTTAEINNTTVATAGTPETMVADSFNIATGWLYRPPADERIILEPSKRLVVRVTVPADALTMNGTLIFEEIGKIPS